MRLLPCGERAVLVELASLDEVLAAEATLRTRAARGTGPWRQVIDIVAAARTVLVTYHYKDMRAAISEALAGLRPGVPEPVGEVTIDVVYDGEDLAEVAELTGLSPKEIVGAHIGTPWRVAFGGFAPGFAYLIGGDPRLRVPRRVAPRQRVPAGSVGLADEFSGIYPTSSPGGWRLIGRSAATLFDPRVQPPALLRSGTQVRFRQVTELPGETPEPSLGTFPIRRGLRVERTLLPITVQDGGRAGLAAVGVNASGAVDCGSYRRGAWLVGNQFGEAALEITMGGCAVRAVGTLTVALTGAPCPAHIDGRLVPMELPVTLPDGAVLSLGSPTTGLRTYLSVRGGIDVSPVLGSRATDQLGGLGPAPLLAGAEVPIGEGAPGWIPGELTLPAPAASDDVVLSYIPGPRDDWVAGLAFTRWRTSAAVDRIGVRLEGTPVARRDGELLSEPVVRGAIQVPPSGQPVLFLADHPLTGGYPVAGVLTVASADRAAQLRPGDEVVLVPVGAEVSGTRLD